MFDTKLKANPNLKIANAEKTEDANPPLRDIDTSVLVKQLEDSIKLREMPITERLKKGLLQ